MNSECIESIQIRLHGQPWRKQEATNMQLQINGKSVEMMIDPGASVNLLDESTFARIESHDNEG